MCRLTKNYVLTVLDMGGCNRARVEITSIEYVVMMACEGRKLDLPMAIITEAKRVDAAPTHGNEQAHHQGQPVG